MFRRVVTAVVVAGALSASSVVGAEAATLSPAGAASLQTQINRELKASPSGQQVDTNTIAWQGGDVVEVFPLPGAEDAPATAATSVSSDGGAQASPLFGTSYVHNCPYATSVSWYCFYQYTNFHGRRLQFEDCSRGGTTQYFINFNFNAMTRAWVDTPGGPGVDVLNGNTILWRESGGHQDNDVGVTKRDHATHFTAFC